MLAYDLNADVNGAVTGGANNIQILQDDPGMDAPATFWASTVRPVDPRIRETRHRRTNNADPFVIHHLFMACHPIAPMLPNPPPKPSKAPRKLRKSKKAKRT